MKPRHRHGSRPLGLYEAKQIRGQSPFTFFGSIIVGTVIFLAGGFGLAAVFVARSRETAAFGSADLHFSALLLASLLLITGVFVAHTGIIYYFRRLLARFRRLRRSHRSEL